MPTTGIYFLNSRRLRPLRLCDGAEQGVEFAAQGRLGGHDHFRPWTLRHWPIGLILVAPGHA
jgi:hypothetical protein